MRGHRSGQAVRRLAASARAGVAAAVTVGALLAGASPASATAELTTERTADTTAGAAADTTAATPAAPPAAQHGLGALPSRSVVRAGALRTASTGTAGPAAALPASLSLRNDAPVPGNQGALNSCVAWAVDYTLLGWWARRDHQAGAPFAPMYAYSQVAGGQDGGSYPYQVLDLTAAQGADTAADYAQGAYDFHDRPTAAERASAAHHKITDYDVVFSGAGQGGAVRTAMSAALVAHGPATLTIPVDGAFEHLHPGHASYPGLSGRVLGAHEVVVVGYDLTGVTIENSWGTGWGQGGFAHLSWGFVEAQAWDSYVVTGLASTSLPVPAVHTVTAASGPTRGWTATVTGSGFTRDSVVRVGGRTARVVAVPSATQMVVALPAAPAGTAGVTVLTTGIASPAAAGARVTYLG